MITATPTTKKSTAAGPRGAGARIASWNHRVEKRRVVLVNMPPILRHILKGLLDEQSDVAVAGEVRLPAELPQAIASLRADAVILILSPLRAFRSLCAGLRASHPEIILLGLAPSCDTVLVWPPHSGPQYIEMTASGIIGALRGTTHGIVRTAQASQ